MDRGEIYYSASLEEEPFAEFGKMKLEGDETRILADKRFNAITLVNNWIYGIELIGEPGPGKESFEDDRGWQPRWTRIRTDGYQVQMISPYPVTLSGWPDKAHEANIEAQVLFVIAVFLLALIGFAVWFSVHKWREDSV